MAHRQLTARAAAAAAPDEAPLLVPGGMPTGQVPLLDPLSSLSMFLRAVRRDLTAGERAGLAAGADAARAHDVYAARPTRWRNHTWETDHVQAPRHPAQKATCWVSLISG